MRVLLAFDKFKDSLTAPEACAHAAAAIRAAHPDWSLQLCPLTDGGEGFCDILSRAAGARLEAHTVTGPRGQPVSAPIGFARLEGIPPAARALLQLGDRNGELAIIEMASASGLALLAAAERDPWQTTSVGTGELIRLAAARGVAAILLGVGGSATNDLGLGALSALGLAGISASGRPITPPIPARWPEILQFAGSAGSGLPPIRIGCDVTNPLLGPRGAAAVYGPQKGLRPDDLPRLDHESARLGLMLCAHCRQPDALMDVPGAGAAGGIAFGFLTATAAKLLPGFDLVSAWLDLETHLQQADLVITGEGRFDESSLQGKGPGAVAARALALGKEVHVFAGQATGAHLPAHLTLHSITPADLPLPQALRQAPQLLAAAVRAAL